MQDKFNMTQEENVFYAKRNIIDYIWKSARLEGLSVTFPDTEAIYNGVTDNYMKVDEVVAVNNLKHAWQFLFETLDYPFDYPYLCKLHQLVVTNLVLNAGYIRQLDVKMGGTTWKPELPSETEVREKLADLCRIGNVTERALTIMLYCMRTQIFLDGNKRVSMLAGNQILISQGKGIISVPIEKQNEFREKLIRFYESGVYAPMLQYTYDNCLEGMQPIKKKELEKPLPDEDYFIREARKHKGKTR